jgi:hypothetical protein
MENKRKRAHDIADEDLGKILRATKSRPKTDRSHRKIDPKALEELAEEVEHDEQAAERIVVKK